MLWRRIRLLLLRLRRLSSRIGHQTSTALEGSPPRTCSLLDKPPTCCPLGTPLTCSPLDRPHRTCSAPPPTVCWPQAPPPPSLTEHQMEATMEDPLSMLL